MKCLRRWMSLTNALIKLIPNTKRPVNMQVTVVRACTGNCLPTQNKTKQTKSQTDYPKLRLPPHPPKLLIVEHR